MFRKPLGEGRGRFLVINAVGATLFLSLMLFLILDGIAQENPRVQINSPLPGTVIEAGSTLTIVVRIGPGKPFTHVLVQFKGRFPMATRQIPSGANEVTFQVPVPKDKLGVHQLIALAFRKPQNPNQEVEGEESLSVPLDVETDLAITTLEMSPKSLDFFYAGDQHPFQISGVFEDGSRLYIAASTRTSYVTANNGVVLVSGEGMVTAVGGGSTAITVSYGSKSVPVSVTVPVTIRGDLDGDKDVDQDDINIVLSAIQANAKPTGTFDARDLNKDGLITEADVDILRTLCTRANCAT